MHRDIVPALPPNFELLGSTPKCEVQGLALSTSPGQPIRSLQDIHVLTVQVRFAWLYCLCYCYLACPNMHVHRIGPSRIYPWHSTENNRQPRSSGDLRGRLCARGERASRNRTRWCRRHREGYMGCACPSRMNVCCRKEIRSEGPLLLAHCRSIACNHRLWYIGKYLVLNCTV